MSIASPKLTTPWVSFCMTTRKRPDFLRKTLSAILRQTVQDLEVIVSDNDPEGSGRAVIESLADPRLRYYCNEADLGMNASFNRSLSRATGEWVVMITDDDPIYPDMLETVRDLSVNHPGYGAYFGGCDVFHVNPEIASFTLHRVGHNSCLAPIRLGTVRQFTTEQFPHAFFGGELEMYLLWSVGMVRRKIAQRVGGMPDYGSPYLGDFAYTATACSQGGCVVINQALGVQTVHDFNFGRKECGDLRKAAEGFVDYIMQKMSNRPDWQALKPKVERFVGQWVVLHCLFLKQYFRHLNITDHDLAAVLKDCFRVRYIRAFRRYYHLGGLFLSLQRAQVTLRNSVLRRMRR